MANAPLPDACRTDVDYRTMAGQKISVDAALDLIRRSIPPLPAENCPVDADLLDHVASRPIYAAYDSPRFDCSAMDGFAVRSADTLRATAGLPVRLALGPEIAAQGPPACLGQAEACPISTGGPIPEGADAVIVYEICEISDGGLLIRKPAQPGLNIRRRGEDVAAGRRVVEAGTLMSPEAIGALCSYGIAHIWCRRPPRLAAIPTGNEIIRAGDIGGASRLDTNGPMLGALARQLGLECRIERPVPDALDALTAAIAALSRASRPDIILSTGGVSGGNYDLVRTALEKLSARIIFHGVAMRPGKPILFALLSDGRPFFGLPGNPVAALVGFRFFVTAAIRNLMGLPPENGRPIDAQVAGREGLTRFLSARHPRKASCEAVPLEEQRSHIMGSPMTADCWLRVDRAGSKSRVALYSKRPSLYSPTGGEPG